jgi:rod shape-determining protein MreC
VWHRERTKPQAAEMRTVSVDARRRTGYLLLVVLLGHLTLISIQVNTASGVTVLQAVLFGVLSETQRAVASTIGAVAQAWVRAVALRGVEEENDRLRRENAALEVRLQEQRALASRGERLQVLLELREAIPQRTLAAEVIAGDASPYFRTVTVDKGRAQGVTTDMAVLSHRGVVGRVLGEPAPRAARVQLLIDRQAGAGALIERSRAGGVVVGHDALGLRMQYVSNLSDVEVGDTVVTSGLDGIYPKGFVIGEVVSAERGQGLYQEIVVRPAVDFASLEEVLIVLDGPAGAGIAEGVE